MEIVLEVWFRLKLRFSSSKERLFSIFNLIDYNDFMFQYWNLIRQFGYLLYAFPVKKCHDLRMYLGVFGFCTTIHLLGIIIVKVFMWLQGSFCIRTEI